MQRCEALPVPAWVGTVQAEDPVDLCGLVDIPNVVEPGLAEGLEIPHV